MSQLLVATDGRLASKPACGRRKLQVLEQCKNSSKRELRFLCAQRCTKREEHSSGTKINKTCMITIIK
eukprot:6190337-Pleurochrysis_carterae.AAC.1